MQIWQDSHFCPEGNERCPTDDTIRDLLIGRIGERTAHEVESVFSECRQCVRRCETMTINDDVVAALGEQRPSSLAGGNVEQLISQLLRNHSTVDAENGLGLNQTLPAGNEELRNASVAGTQAVDLPRRFGNYELLEIAARGGMGVVYRARHVPLNRIVALKLILAGTLATDEATKRFYNEAELAAKLAHPNIVTVHDVGECDGQHYIAMDFVEGQSAADRLKDGPLPTHVAASLTQTIAAAVQYAHGQGIVHRDLKPANVMLGRNASTGQPDPRITDFGLAKQINSGDSPTLSGQVMGTPYYMSPEQARGDLRDIGPKSDIYSLGATLYEMVTGRPPFRAAGVVETLRQLLERDPVSPRLLNPDIDLDLETICLKCLEKDPAKRYATAGALVQDLGRYLRNEPISARPISRLDRTWRWCIRFPARAALIVLASLSILAAVGLGVAWKYQGQLESKNEALASANHTISKARDELSRKNDSLESTNHTLKETRDELAKRKREVDQLLYVRQVRLALTQELPRARDLLDACDVSLRGWEWHYAYRKFHPGLRTLRGHRGGVYSVSFSKDGNHVVSGGADNTVRVWDARSGQQLTILRGHTSPVTGAVFSPDGKQIATSSHDKTVKVWDATTGRCRRTYLEHMAPATDVSFSTDGTLIASSSKSETGALRVFESASGKTVFVLSEKTGPINRVMFRPKGQTSRGTEVAAVLSRVEDNLRMWDISSGATTFSPPRKSPRKPGGRHRTYRDIGFTRDGTWLASGRLDNSAVFLWNLKSGRLETVPPSSFPLVGFAISPDGRRVATTVGDSARLTARRGRETYPWRTALAGHTGRIMRMTFSPDGNRLVTASLDGTLVLWGVSHPRPDTWAQLGTGSAATISPDGLRIATADLDHKVRVWSARDGRLIQTLSGAGQQVFALAFDPTGNKVAASVGDGSDAALNNAIKVWDVSTSQTDVLLKGHQLPTFDISFSPDGRQLVTASDDKTVRIWDVETGKEVLKYGRHTKAVREIAMSPDGRLIASAAIGDDTVRIWNVKSGVDQHILMGQSRPAALAFSPDSRELACGGEKKILIWNMVDGRVVREWRSYVQGVTSLTYTPDGKRIAANGRTIQLWDTKSGHEVLTFKRPGGRMALRFEPNGERLVAAGGRAFRVWDARVVE